ncbi:MAG TPA: tetratricopeptide repeat protein [Thermoleophilia bacterium]|nr:tetratricopeptide repeat protein [Thermoleophilia bacterium]
MGIPQRDEEITLLLDRRRIKKWAKWIALFLAIVFGASFLFLGVGYGGGAGFDLSSLFKGDDSSNTAEQTPDEKLAAYNETLKQNPNDITALLGAATLLQQANNYAAAVVYLEKAIAADPNQKDVYIRLANLYMSQDLSDYQAAATVLNKATAVDPNNPDVYLKLGSAQSSLGNTQAAILAWQKYLELAPNGEMAPVVQEQITKLSAKPTTTTTAGATTTTSGGSSTTTTGAGSSTTTSSSTP